MGIFRKATRLGGRVAKNAARQIIAPEDEKSKKDKGDKSAEPAAPQHSDAEYDELQEKYNALMTEKWKEYYKTSCDGECETCEYYDWCPDDFDGVFEDETPAEDAKAESAAAEGEEAVAPDVDEGAEADEADEAVEVEVEEENDVELTDEERAAKAAAEAYYEDGCDGDCDNCEHYDWCPAEEEGEDEDDKVLFKGVTQGDVKNAAKGGVELARETALAARDLKEALDDITGGMNLKELLK